MGPKTLRKDTEVFLLGHYESQIVGIKLPSNKQVLSVLFYNLREIKLSNAKSISLAIRETLVFWEKARIPTRGQDKCEQKLKSLHNEWRELQKSKTKKSEVARKKEEKFVNELENLFDISHANAMEMITIEQDKLFLTNQRQPGRVGCFGSVDMQAKRLEDKHVKKMEAVNQRKRKAQEDVSSICKYIFIMFLFLFYTNFLLSLS
uniref:Uncharacterized protein n=1 Tax=Cacopsylla melanoneura TaxID=428564 RepID=A0A8D8TNB5_9HEMI